ncbi:MAG TPA: hypothetical protein VLH75_20500 [Longimicrobiales bacterium]|nr:hypothetical protein [Longimicrobiales bacterium]
MRDEQRRKQLYDKDPRKVGPLKKRRPAKTHRTIIRKGGKRR